MADSEARYLAQRFAFSRALAIAGITVTLAIPVAFYGRASATEADHIPLISPDGRGFYLASLFLIAVIAVIIQALETDDPARLVNRYGERLYRFRRPAPRTAWMLPSVAMFALFLLVAQYPRLIIVAVVPLLAGAIVVTGRMVRFELLNHYSGSPVAIRAVHYLLVYGTAAGVFLAVFGFRARTIYSGPVMLLAAALLLMALYDGVQASGTRRAIFALAGGVAVAQVSWALGFWNVSTLRGGTMLLLVFLFFGVVSRSWLAGELTRSRVAASAGVAAPLYLLLAWTVN